MHRRSKLNAAGCRADARQADQASMLVRMRHDAQNARVEAASPHAQHEHADADVHMLLLMAFLHFLFPCC